MIAFLLIGILLCLFPPLRRAVGLLFWLTATVPSLELLDHG
jgi:uncharacterized RDD family membrane protein YckC